MTEIKWPQNQHWIKYANYLLFHYQSARKWVLNKLIIIAGGVNAIYINNLAPKKWQEILCFIWWKNVRVFYNVVCNARQITTMHIVWNEKLSSREVNFLGLYLLLWTDLFSNLVSYWQSLSCKNPPWKLIYFIYVVTGMRFTKELITKVVNISSLIEWSSIKIYIRPFVFCF